MISRLVPLSLALAIPLAAFPASVSAQEESQSPLAKRAADVVEVIQGAKSAEDIFAPSFLKVVSPAKFGEISHQLIDQFGPIQGVESVTPVDEFSATIILRFEKALGTTAISIDQAEPHLINGLRLQSFETLNDSAAKVTSDLEALPGGVGVLFARLDGKAKPLLAINPDTQFAIGSTFKLYILSALARSIENGERKWSDVVELDRKSFPSGQLQNWPKGAPVTLQTLATMMISISDNTATDMLLYELGRDTVEAELLASGHSDPDRTLPFLSTLQMFALKGSPANMAKYIAADEAGQRRILADFEDDVGGNRNLVTPPRFVEPTAIDTLEWFASGHDLEKLAGRITALTDPVARKILSVNPSLPKATVDEWQYAGYKGGSEPGVLNLTWLLQDEADHWYIMSMSWNNTAANVDLQTFELLAQRVIALAN